MWVEPTFICLCVDAAIALFPGARTRLKPAIVISIHNQLLSCKSEATYQLRYRIELYNSSLLCCLHLLVPLYCLIHCFVLQL